MYFAISLLIAMTVIPLLLLRRTLSYNLCNQCARQEALLGLFQIKGVCLNIIHLLHKLLMLFQSSLCRFGIVYIWRMRRGLDMHLCTLFSSGNQKEKWQALMGLYEHDDILVEGWVLISSGGVCRLFWWIGTDLHICSRSVIHLLLLGTLLVSFQMTVPLTWSNGHRRPMLKIFLVSFLTC